MSKAWDAGSEYGLYTSGTVSVNDMSGLGEGPWERRSGRGQEAAGRKHGIHSRDSSPLVSGGEQGRAS